MGIEVKHDLAPVGANLHDHFNSYVAWRSTKTGTFNEIYRSPIRKLAAVARYLVERDGPMTAIATHAGILTRTDPIVPISRSTRISGQSRPVTALACIPINGRGSACLPFTCVPRVVGW
jgi:choline dehydrogenase-like flavoprotein